jgi:hypothetical protein
MKFWMFLVSHDQPKRAAIPHLKPCLQPASRGQPFNAQERLGPLAVSE